MKYSVKNTMLYLCLFAIICFNYSCSDDNYIIPEVEIEESDPDTIEYTYVTGVVRNIENEPLTNIDIEYIIDGVTLSTTTDENGVYEIRELDETVIQTTIRCHGNGYEPKVEIIHINEENSVKNDVILAKTGQFSGSPTGSLVMQSVDDLLFSVEGRLINESGEGVPSIMVYLVDLSFTTFLYAITDSEGNWSIATEGLGTSVLAVGNECDGVQALLELEAVDADVNVDDIATDLIAPVKIQYSGFITDCYTKEGLLNGVVQFQFQDFPKIYSADITYGEYEIELPQCYASDCLDIIIFSYQSQSGTDTLLCQTFDVGSNTLDYEVCNEETTFETNGGFLTYVVNGDTTSFDYVEVQEDAGGYLIAASNIELQQAAILGTDSFDSSGQMRFAGIVDLVTLAPIYTAGPGTIDYQIESITEDFMFGSYNGTTINSVTGIVTPIEGEFKAEIIE